MNGDDRTVLERFIDGVAAGRDDRARRVALFLAVRDLPYATDGASDAEGSVAMGEAIVWRKPTFSGTGFAGLASKYGE